MSEHTPGPWELDERACYIFHDGKPIGQVHKRRLLTGAASLKLAFEEAEAIQRANGLLMAAAPDLLAACEEVAEIVVAIENAENPRDLVEYWKLSVLPLIRAAIAKAKGEQP